jgi:nicotinate phosphoribosyltransferase
MEKKTQSIYNANLSLLTDLYQLTMAYGYHRTGTAEREAVFHLYYRRAPFILPPFGGAGGGFVIAAGLATAIDYLQNLHFSEADVSYLGTLHGAGQKPLFDEHFLNYLQRLKFSCDIEAIEEGTAVFPHQPLLRVRGPLLQAQLIETTLLTALNFSTLIATKAARVKAAAGTDAVLEFGLRRAQGFDGGLTASRAAYIGGCDATSNVLAGQLFDIPVRGTHAHAWVMAHDDEQTAFDHYAEAMPQNTTLLVDTYDTLEGVKKAIETGKKLRQRGFDLQGIRLDSGDMARLSIEARKLLDGAGFQKTNIVASSDLDEYEIERLKKADAKINVWGIGTKLVTAFDQPALGGVYKLAAIRNAADTAWQYKQKRSEDAIKNSIGGILQTRRSLDNQSDTLYDESRLPQDLPKGENMLKPIFERGKCVYTPPNIHQTRQRALQQWQFFSENANWKNERKI